MPSLLRRAAALATLSALPALTQAADLYKVEMLVFSHENTAGATEEYWPERPPLELSDSLYPQPWDGYPLSNFEELPKNDLQLGGDAAALSRSADYKLLYHRGWLQSIGSQSRARKVHIKADFEQYQLDGSVRIHKQRYLHAHSKLELKTSGTKQIMTGGAAQNSSEQGSTVRTVTPVGIDTTESQSWRMDQSRRMRSSETHYIDHPRFGVLLRIRPVN